jgi:hypothetical protein
MADESAQQILDLDPEYGAHDVYDISQKAFDVEYNKPIWKPCENQNDLIVAIRKRAAYCAAVSAALAGASRYTSVIEAYADINRAVNSARETINDRFIADADPQIQRYGEACLRALPSLEAMNAHRDTVKATSLYAMGMVETMRRELLKADEETEAARIALEKENEAFAALDLADDPNEGGQGG